MTNINAQTKIFCIFGHPAAHSLSPQMHNFTFAKDQLNCVYLVFDVVNIKKAIESFRLLKFAGASITVPHKIAVMKYLDKFDPLAQNIGACNTVVRKDNKLIGFNTDWYGAITPLKIKFGANLKSRKAVLLGAGGAARSIAYGLHREKIPFVILNRTIDKAIRLAKDTKAVAADSLCNFKKYTAFDIVINATSLGLEGLNEDRSPIETKLLSSHQVVFDIVYKPKTTRLLSDARKKGCQIIYGYNMLLYQAELQYKLFTGHIFPTDEVEKMLVQRVLSY